MRREKERHSINPIYIPHSPFCVPPKVCNVERIIALLTLRNTSGRLTPRSRVPVSFNSLYTRHAEFCCRRLTLQIVDVIRLELKSTVEGIVSLIYGEASQQQTRWLVLSCPKINHQTTSNYDHSLTCMKRAILPNVSSPRIFFPRRFCQPRQGIIVWSTPGSLPLGAGSRSSDRDCLLLLCEVGEVEKAMARTVRGWAVLRMYWRRRAIL